MLAARSHNNSQAALRARSQESHPPPDRARCFVRPRASGCPTREGPWLPDRTQEPASLSPGNRGPAVVRADAGTSESLSRSQVNRREPRWSCSARSPKPGRGATAASSLPTAPLRPDGGLRAPGRALATGRRPSRSRPRPSDRTAAFALPAAPVPSTAGLLAAARRWVGESRATHRGCRLFTCDLTADSVCAHRLGSGRSGRYDRTADSVCALRL